MYRRALVMSVGTGTRPDADMAAPLVQSIKDSHAEMIYLLVTEQSQKTADTIQQRLRPEGYGAEGAITVIDVAHPDNIERVFSDAMAVFRAIEQRGVAPADIEVDFTSGTKPMSAGLALAGAAIGCGKLKYMSGIRQGGVVVPGTEQAIGIAPKTIAAYANLRLASNLLHNLRYDATIELAEAVIPELLDERGKKERIQLMELAKAYQSWDLFQYERFKASYHKATEHGDLPRIVRDCTVASDLPNRLARMKIDEKGSPGELPSDLLADLLNNAHRRLHEGRYDDATSRLYRLTEMVAQRTLHTAYGIHSDDIDVGHVPEGQRAELERQRDPRDGKIKIGLTRSYSLLEALGHSVGQQFMADSALNVLLATRNNSLLAHGVKPVPEKDCQGLYDRVRDLVRQAIPDLNQRCTDLQFPWLRGEAT